MESDCHWPIHARGFCKAHHAKFLRDDPTKLLPKKVIRGRDTSLREKFLSIGWRETSGCWIWSGRKFRLGYGSIYWDGRLLSTHRVSYLLNVGDIPEGIHVLHSCDNPPCVNPLHLRLGTHAENMRDKAERGRNAEMKGERNPASKITQDVADSIRSTWHQGGVKSKAQLARDFGVSEGIVHNVLSGRHWSP